MRRTIRAAAVPALTVLGLAAASAPAGAATGSLTVIAINRSGQKVVTKAHLYRLSTEMDYSVTTGKKRKLSTGRYGVDVKISSGSTRTLGVRSVWIGTKHVTITFDARKGKQIKITPSSSPTRFEAGAEACIGGHVISGMDYSTAASNGWSSYVIPTTDKYIRMAFASIWSSSESGPFHSAVSGPSHGVPASPVYDYTHASFAKVLVKVTKGNVTSKATTFYMEPIGRCHSGVSGWGPFAAPRTVTSYATTGTWRPFIDYRDGWTYGKKSRFVAPKTYHVTLKRSR
jgi:hypothetical protein